MDDQLLGASNKSDAGALVAALGDGASKASCKDDNVRGSADAAWLPLPATAAKGAHARCRVAQAGKREPLATSAVPNALDEGLASNEPIGLSSKELLSAPLKREAEEAVEPENAKRRAVPEKAAVAKQPSCVADERKAAKKPSAVQRVATFHAREEASVRQRFAAQAAASKSQASEAHVDADADADADADYVSDAESDEPSDDVSDEWCEEESEESDEEALAKAPKPSKKQAAAVSQDAEAEEATQHAAAMQQPADEAAVKATAAAPVVSDLQAHEAVAATDEVAIAAERAEHPAAEEYLEAAAKDEPAAEPEAAEADEAAEQGIVAHQAAVPAEPQAAAEAATADDAAEAAAVAAADAAADAETEALRAELAEWLTPLKLSEFAQPLVYGHMLGFLSDCRHLKEKDLTGPGIGMFLVEARRFRAAAKEQWPRRKRSHQHQGTQTDDAA